MHQLPPDRKRYLLQQNREVRAATLSRASGAKSSQATSSSYSTSIGPAAAAGLIPRLVPQLTGDNGVMKRLSIAGWGASAPVPTSPSLANGELPRSHTGNATTQATKLPEEAKPVRSQSTGGLWSSWWASSGGESVGEKMKTPKWYADGINNTKALDMKVVKHLISLRVHLSTAQIDWIDEFVRVEKGMDALGSLLAGLVGKGGKRRKLTDNEESVLLELVKSLRVLLNTEVRTH